MKSFGRAFLFAGALVIVPGVDWNFNTHTPPRAWVGYSTAFYFINDPWVPQDFRPEIDQAAFTWGSAGSNWFFTPAGIVLNGSYLVRDGYSLVDFIVPTDPDAAGETFVFTAAGDDTQIIEVDTALNSSFPYSISGEPGSYDVQSVALHELGHWLELLHSDNPGDVMYRRIGPGDVKRVLSFDDIDGVRYLYPIGGGPHGSGGGQGGGGQICHKVGGCKVCEQVNTITLNQSLRTREIESLGELQTFMLEKPRRRAVLFAILMDLPELEHIARNHEDEVVEAWEPVTKDWVPGLYWLTGDVVRGQNLVLTKERADALDQAIRVIRTHSSRSLGRDLEKTSRFIRTHVGHSLEELRTALFEAPAPQQ